jgi:putative addiction module component (TIGR02574 family)
MTTTTKIFKEALELPPTERASLIEHLFSSFKGPDTADLEAKWAQEAEQRIDAYDEGKISTVDANKVFEKINEES